MTKNTISIQLSNVSLKYDLHFDRTNNLKEAVINFITRKKYVDKKKDTLLALNSINLTVYEGERVGIIGLNGAGKSTLLKVISGILKPSGGEIFVNGEVPPLSGRGIFESRCVRHVT